MLGFGGFLGFLLQIFLIVLLVRFLIRRFRGQSLAFAGGAGMFARGGPPGPVPTGGFGRSPSSGPPPIQIGPQDYHGFEQLLQGIQAAWSRQDLNALRAIATPEMLSYFAEQLADQTSRGVRNEVTDVRLLQGDLSQAWSEGNREYATVAMRFAMIDVTRDATGRIVDGSPSEHVTATELWTFVRSPEGSGSCRQFNRHVRSLLSAALGQQHSIALQRRDFVGRIPVLSQHFRSVLREFRRRSARAARRASAT